MFVAFFIERLGRVGAFNVSTAGWIPCGLLLLGTGALEGRVGRRAGSLHTIGGLLCEQPMQRLAALLMSHTLPPAACSLDTGTG